MVRRARVQKRIPLKVPRPPSRLYVIAMQNRVTDIMATKDGLVPEISSPAASRKTVPKMTKGGIRYLAFT
jgi:hypothetical protein